VGADRFGCRALDDSARLRCGLALAQPQSANHIAGWIRADSLSFLKEARSDAFALVPADAPVAATNRLAAHLSERRYVYSVPVLGRACWVAVDLDEPWFPSTPIHPGGLDRGRMARFIATLDRDPRWQLVFERASVRVYHRVE
jgi:hypothetical protein